MHDAAFITWVQETAFLGIPLWSLLLALAASVATYGVIQVVLGLLTRRANTWAAQSSNSTAQALADVVAGTSRFLVLMVALLVGASLLDLPGRWESRLSQLWFVAVALQMGLWGMRAIGLGVRRYVDRHSSAGMTQVSASAMLLSWGLRTLLWSVVMLAILSNVGVNITAFVASLGVGGIAVALAMQNILGDLFASLAIAVDKPFEVGDFIAVGDITGTVLETAPVTAGERELQAVLPQFVGKQMQVPPMYSAVKVGGQPLYKLAREGKTVERKARPIEIYSITYGGSPAENEYVLEVTCSKGTYIRTLLEDIADALGQKGTMSALRRTCAGLYTEADAHTLEEILAAKEQGPAALEALMLPVESVFTPLPLLVVEPWVEQHLYNGCPTSRYPAADGRYRVRNAAGQFLGLANITGGVLRVEKLFVERN